MVSPQLNSLRTAVPRPEETKPAGNAALVIPAASKHFCFSIPEFPEQKRGI
jgi:hypothetical protein